MPDSLYAVGVDLGGTSIKVGLVTKKGKIIRKKELKSYAEKGPETVIKQIKKGIGFIIKGYRKNVIGIGIGSPGSIILKKGTVENPPNFPDWESVPLGKIIKKEFDKDVFVENDANAAAIGELIFGAGKTLDNFIMITLGTGVGGGIIIDRKIYRGENGAAGEIGHVSINGDGPKCNCGSLGCIEAYIGNKYLIYRVKEELKLHTDSKILELIKGNENLLTPKIVYKAVKLGDEYASAVIEDVGKKLGVALGSIVNLLDICNIIIGGGLAGFGNVLFKSTERSIKERVVIPLKPKIKVIPAKLKNEAGIKGASALVFYRS